MAVDKIALNQELEAAQRTLTGQEATLAQTLAVIDAIKSPDGTVPKRIIDKRNRQHQAVVNTQAYIQRLQEALKKGPRTP